MAELNKYLVKCVSDILVYLIFFICVFDLLFLVFKIDCTVSERETKIWLWNVIRPYNF